MTGVFTVVTVSRIVRLMRDEAAGLAAQIVWLCDVGRDSRAREQLPLPSLIDRDPFFQRRTTYLYIDI
jgi:hypothetical protein